jgi:hypothetical protein
MSLSHNSGVTTQEFPRPNFQINFKSKTNQQTLGRTHPPCLEIELQRVMSPWRASDSFGFWKLVQPKAGGAYLEIGLWKFEPT